MAREFREIELSLLKPAPWNYKDDDDGFDEKLRANLERNDCVQNLIVRELGDGSYEVVNGNHRLKLLLDMGQERVMCYDCGAIIELAAKKLAIETNETRFKSDPKRMVQLVDIILSEFQIEDFQSTMPIPLSAIEAFREAENFIPPPPLIDIPFLDLGSSKKHYLKIECPACGHATEIEAKHLEAEES